MEPNMVRRDWLDDVAAACAHGVGFIRFLLLVLTERRRPYRDNN
jgi:hypothetical protein